MNLALNQLGGHPDDHDVADNFDQQPRPASKVFTPEIEAIIAQRRTEELLSENLLSEARTIHRNSELDRY